MRRKQSRLDKSEKSMFELEQARNLMFKAGCKDLFTQLAEQSANSQSATPTKELDAR